MASKWTLAQYTDGWPDQVFQDISSDIVEYGVSAGTTFTPLLPLTPERVGALRLYVDAFGCAPSDWPELANAYHTLREMLAEMEGATNEN